MSDDGAGVYARRLRETVPTLRDRIAEAARAGGRRPEEVRLVAVTKGHPLAAVRAAIAAGLGDLGENRVAELEEKATALPDAPVRWHMIGHVQRRKAESAATHAHLIHSVDSLRLAERISRVAEAEGRAPVRILLQVNTSGEEQKYGFRGPSALDDMALACSLPNVRVDGLMTMAPFTDDERVLRATFAGCRDLATELRARAPDLGSELSMGMTNDLGVAVEEGSTMVRIGTALFGERR